MPAPYYQLLGHIFLTSRSAKAHEPVRKNLERAKFGKTRIETGLKLVERGEALIEEKTRQSVVDKSMEHNLHSAIAEVEMWHQTVRFRLRRAGIEAEAAGLMLGDDLHAHSHMLSVIVQAQRTLAQLRVRPEILESWGSEQSLRDTIMRGNTMLYKALKVTEITMTPSSFAPADLPVFAELEEHVGKMTEWFEALEVASAKLGAKKPSVLGMIGHVPADVGIPVGRGATGITHHAPAVREAPAREFTETSGWSVGRQGNNENDGKGWIASAFGAEDAEDTAEA